MTCHDPARQGTPRFSLALAKPSVEVSRPVSYRKYPDAHPRCDRSCGGVAPASDTVHLAWRRRIGVIAERLCIAVTFSFYPAGLDPDRPSTTQQAFRWAAIRNLCRSRRPAAPVSASWDSHEPGTQSLCGACCCRVVAWLLTYTAAWLSQCLSPGWLGVRSLGAGKGGFRSFSVTGTWVFFISSPILVYYTHLWPWRQVRGRDHRPHQSWISRRVANRILNKGKTIGFSFSGTDSHCRLPLICVLPYLLFTRTLMLMRRRGMSAMELSPMR